MKRTFNKFVNKYELVKKLQLQRQRFINFKNQINLL